MSKVAVIVGSGADRLFHEMLEKDSVETPYGNITTFTSEDLDAETPIIARHRLSHVTPPHLVNYRGNIDALSRLGVERIVGLGAVGSLRSSLRPGDLVFPDQFLDFTKGRQSTFSDAVDRPVKHVDVTEPFCEEMRRIALSSAKDLEIPVHPRAVYVCTEGPRYETAAEIRMFKMLGGDLVGMTCVPECILARERGMCYLHLSLVTNMAAGIKAETITHEKVERVISSSAIHVRRLVRRVVENASAGERECGCAGKAE